MNNLVLQVDIDEVNTILEALGALPYVRVYRLIATIHRQASEQLDVPPDAAIEDC
jgi:hypothetical protein